MRVAAKAGHIIEKEASSYSSGMSKWGVPGERETIWKRCIQARKGGGADFGSDRSISRINSSMHRSQLSLE